MMKNASDRLGDDIISLIIDAASKDPEALQDTARMTESQLDANMIANSKGSLPVVCLLSATNRD
jgi:hypothetical protein